MPTISNAPPNKTASDSIIAVIAEFMKAHQHSHYSIGASERYETIVANVTKDSVRDRQTSSSSNRLYTMYFIQLTKLFQDTKYPANGKSHTDIAAELINQIRAEHQLSPLAFDANIPALRI